MKHYNVCMRGKCVTVLHVCELNYRIKTNRQAKDREKYERSNSQPARAGWMPDKVSAPPTNYLEQCGK